MPIWPSLLTPPKALGPAQTRRLCAKTLALPQDPDALKQLIDDTHPTQRPALVQALETLREVIPALAYDPQVQNTCFGYLAQKYVPHVQACVAALQAMQAPLPDPCDPTSPRLSILACLLRLPPCEVAETARGLQRLPPGLRVAACADLMAPMVQPQEKTQFVESVLAILPRDAGWQACGGLLQFFARLPMDERPDMARMLGTLKVRSMPMAGCMRVATRLAAIASPDRAQVAALVQGREDVAHLIAALGDLPDAASRQHFMDGLAPILAKVNRIDAMAVTNLLAGVDAKQRSALFAAYRLLLSHNETPATDIVPCLRMLAPLAGERVLCRHVVPLRHHGRYGVATRTLLEAAIDIAEPDRRPWTAACKVLLDATHPDLLRHALSHLKTLPVDMWCAFAGEAVAFAGGNEAALSVHLGLLQARLTHPAGDWPKVLQWAQAHVWSFGGDVVVAANVAKDIPANKRAAVAKRLWRVHVEYATPQERADLARCLLPSLAYDVDHLLKVADVLEPFWRWSHKHADKLQALQVAGELLAGIPRRQVPTLCVHLEGYLSKRTNITSDRVRYARAFLQPCPKEPDWLAYVADHLCGVSAQPWAERMRHSPDLEALPLARRILKNVAPEHRSEFLSCMHALVDGFGDRDRYALIEQLLTDSQPHDPTVFVATVKRFTTHRAPASDRGAVEAAMAHAAAFLRDAGPAVARARSWALEQLTAARMDDPTRRAVAEAIVAIAPELSEDLANLARYLLRGSANYMPFTDASLSDVRAVLACAVQILAGTRARTAWARVNAIMPHMDHQETLDERLHLATRLAAALSRPPPHWAAAWKYMCRPGDPTDYPGMARAVLDLVEDEQLAPARLQMLRGWEYPRDGWPTRLHMTQALVASGAELSDVFARIVDMLLRSGWHGRVPASITTCMELAAVLARPPEASARARATALGDLMDHTTTRTAGVYVAEMLCRLPHDPPPEFARLITWLLGRLKPVDSPKAQETLEAILHSVLQWLDETPNAAQAVEALVRVLPQYECNDQGVLAAANWLPWLRDLPVLQLAYWAEYHIIPRPNFLNRVYRMDSLVAALSPMQRLQLHHDAMVLEPAVRSATDRWALAAQLAHSMAQPHYDDLMGMLTGLLRADALDAARIATLIGMPTDGRAAQVRAWMQGATPAPPPEADAYRRADRENVMYRGDIGVVHQAINTLRLSMPPMFTAHPTMRRIVAYVKAQRTGNASPALQRSQRNGVREIDNAWRALTAPNGEFDFGVSILDTPELVTLCALIWRRIDMCSPQDQELMREALVLAFAQCIEDDHHRVCDVGRRARFIRVLQGYCPEIVVDPPNPNPSPNALLNQLALEWRHAGNTGDDAATGERFAAQAQDRARAIYGSDAGDYTAFVQGLRTYVGLAYEP